MACVQDAVFPGCGGCLFGFPSCNLSVTDGETAAPSRCQPVLPCQGGDFTSSIHTEAHSFTAERIYIEQARVRKKDEKEMESTVDTKKKNGRKTLFSLSPVKWKILVRRDSTDPRI